MRWIVWLVVMWAALLVGLVASPLGTAMGAVAVVAFLRSGSARAREGPGRRARPRRRAS